MCQIAVYIPSRYTAISKLVGIFCSSPIDLTNLHNKSNTLSKMIKINHTS